MSSSKKGSIEISPKYGANPTMPVCFFCGKTRKGEIAMLGRIYEKDSRGRKIKDSDVEAPKYMVLDYVPCDDCKNGILKKGIAVIEVTDSDTTGYKAISKGLYPTGMMNVIKEEVLERFSDTFDESFIKSVKRKRIVLMDTNDFKQFFSGLSK
jgi:hypothetical protein